jgi:hypothetical protein
MHYRAAAAHVASPENAGARLRTLVTYILPTIRLLLL